MKRDLYDQLLRWKDHPARKPLVIQGARQVGKTWLIKEFGSHEFETMVVLNCDKDPRIREILSGGCAGISCYRCRFAAWSGYS